MSAHHVYVISDLHLGGAPQRGDVPSFQMCPPESRRRLARFIHQIRQPSPARAERDSVELVINGDLVDFLAEKPFEPFTPSGSAAADKLRSIIRTVDEGAPE